MCKNSLKFGILRPQRQNTRKMKAKKNILTIQQSLSLKHALKNVQHPYYVYQYPPRPPPRYGGPPRIIGLPRGAPRLEVIVPMGEPRVARVPRPVGAPRK